MLEGKFTSLICDGLKRRNALVLPFVAHLMSEPGWPDRYVVHSSWCGWLEFKGTTGRVAPIQWHRIAEINRRQPFTAFVARAGVDDGRYTHTLWIAEGEQVGTFTEASSLLALLARLRKEVPHSI